MTLHLGSPFFHHSSLEKAYPINNSGSVCLDFFSCFEEILPVWSWFITCLCCSPQQTSARSLKSFFSAEIVSSLHKLLFRQQVGLVPGQMNQLIFHSLVVYYKREMYLIEVPMYSVEVSWEWIWGWKLFSIISPFIWINTIGVNGRRTRLSCP